MQTKSIQNIFLSAIFNAFACVHVFLLVREAPFLKCIVSIYGHCQNSFRPPCPPLCPAGTIEDFFKLIFSCMSFDIATPPSPSFLCSPHFHILYSFFKCTSNSYYCTCTAVFFIKAKIVQVILFFSVHVLVSIFQNFPREAS